MEDSLPAFLKALKNVTQAHQMTKDAGVQRETLYRSLSEQGNPTLQTLTSVLGAMGLRMRVEAEVADSVGVSGEGAASSRGKKRDVGRAVA